MNQYFILTDSSDNSVYGIAVKTADGTFIKGAHTRANEWASWVNSKSAVSFEEYLPVGVVSSRPHVLRSTDDLFLVGLLDSAISGVHRKEPLKQHLESQVLNPSSATPSVRDFHLSAFDISARRDAVNFKALAFRFDMKINALAAMFRTGRVSLNVKTGLLESRIGGVPASELQSSVDASLARISQRRIGLETHALKLKSLELQASTKRLGPKIGRGLRAAPPGLVFVDITGTVDADVDGIVFEGKPGLERPIIPRFTLPEALGRRVSAMIQGDAEENEKLRRAGQLDESVPVGKLRELLGSDASQITEVDATRAIPRPGRSLGRGTARDAIMRRRQPREGLSRIGKGGKTQFNVRDSRAVEKLSWDDDAKELIVSYNGGRTYTYQGVDDSWIRQIENNPDALGRIINDIKKAGFPFKKGGEHAPDSTLKSRTQRRRESVSMRSVGSNLRQAIEDSGTGGMNDLLQRRGEDVADYLDRVTPIVEKYAPNILDGKTLDSFVSNEELANAERFLANLPSLRNHLRRNYQIDIREDGRVSVQARQEGSSPLGGLVYSAFDWRVDPTTKDWTFSIDLSREDKDSRKRLVAWAIAEDAMESELGKLEGGLGSSRSSSGGSGTFGVNNIERSFRRGVFLTEDEERAIIDDIDTLQGLDSRFAGLVLDDESNTGALLNSIREDIQPGPQMWTPYDQQPPVMDDPTNARLMLDTVNDIIDDQEESGAPIDVSRLTKLLADVASGRTISDGYRQAHPDSLPPPRKGRTRTNISSRSSSLYSGSSLRSARMPSWSDLQRMTKVNGPLGSNGGQWYEDSSTGRKFFTKPGQTPDHAFNESAVAAVYRAAGTPVPNVSVIVDSNGRHHIVSEAVPNLSSSRNLTDPQKSAVKLDMGIDMLLSNWDVYGGGDNTKVGPNGEMFRLDTGGGGLYRARGGAKPSFNPKDPWVEPATMVYSSSGQSKYLYGTVSNSEFAAAMDKVANLDLNAIDTELRSAGVPDAMRTTFMDTIAARQKKARAYVAEFSQYEPNSRVNVSGTTISPGGNKVPQKPQGSGILARFSSRSTTGGFDASKNPILAADAPEQTLYPENFGGGPGLFDSLRVLPNSLNLIQQKRQQSFDRLRKMGVSPQDAASLIIDAHLRSNMRGKSHQLLTSSQMAAYLEYAEGYDSMLEKLDGWPDGTMATWGMKEARRSVDRFARLDSVIGGRNTANSARSLRWTTPSAKTNKPKLRDDIDGVVVARGKEPGGLSFEVIQTPRGDYVLSGIEDIDGVKTPVGYLAAASVDDSLISGEFNSVDQALEAANEYVDGPDASYESEYERMVEEQMGGMWFDQEILGSRSATLNNDGLMQRPTHGFHYADFERMSDKQLFDEYRNAIMRGITGENTVEELMAAQKALEDRRMLSTAMAFLTGKAAPEFDGTGRLLGADDFRRSPLAALRSGSAGNWEINMTLSQLGRLQRDIDLVQNIVDSGVFDLEQQERSDVLEAFRELSSAAEMGVLAVDAVIISDGTMEALGSYLDRAVRDLAGDSGLVGVRMPDGSPISANNVNALRNLGTLLGGMRTSGKRRFVSQKLDEWGSMHDINLSDDAARGRLRNTLDRVRGNLRKQGISDGPSYISSRSRRRVDSRVEDLLRDEYMDSPSFEDGFKRFVREMRDPAARRRLGIGRKREITELDYVNSPSFQDDLYRWEDSKFYESGGSDTDELVQALGRRVIARNSDLQQNMPESENANDADTAKPRSQREPNIADIIGPDSFVQSVARSVSRPDSDIESYRAEPARPRVRVGSPSDRRRIATMERTASARSRRGKDAGYTQKLRPGSSKLVDQDGDIWAELDDQGRIDVARRLAEIEDRLIRDFSGGEELDVSFDSNGNIIEIDGFPGTDDTVELPGGANEYVGLAKLKPNFNFRGTAVELERAPSTEREKALQKRIRESGDAFPYLRGIATTDDSGKPTFTMGLSKAALQSFDKTYRETRAALLRALTEAETESDQPNPKKAAAAKAKASKIRRALADFDSKAVALKTIASARLNGDDGKNEDGGDTFEYVLEQLPSAIRKEALGYDGPLVNKNTRAKKQVFDSWWKETQKDNNGKAKRRGTKEYRTALEKFFSGELEPTIFGWWQKQNNPSTRPKGLPDPGDWLDADGKFIQKGGEAISLPDTIDLDEEHSAKKLGSTLPGIPELRLAKRNRTGRDGGFWSSALFKLARPNNQKWLDRKAAADARRLQALKKGTGSFGGVREDIEKRTRGERRILRRNKAARLKLLAKNQQRPMQDIDSEVARKREALPSIISVDESGAVEITDYGVSALVALQTKKRGGRAFVPSANPTPEELKKIEKENAKIAARNLEQNEALAHVWESAQFNGRPTDVTLAELGEASKQPGAVVIRRGVGGKTWADEYHDDPNRYITGEAGEMQGPGEYWAVRFEEGVRKTDGDSWRGYVSQDKQGGQPGTEPGPGGVVAVLPPTARIVRLDKLEKINSDIRSLAGGGIQLAYDDPNLPKDMRQKVSSENGARLLEMIENNMFLRHAKDSDIWATEAGQIFMQLIQRAKTASSSEERGDILKAIATLVYGSEHGNLTNFLAPLLGYDAVRARNNVMLVMNRSALLTYAGVGGLKMTDAIEAFLDSGTSLPGEMADKLERGQRVD